MSGKAERKRKRAERREQEYSAPVRLTRRVRRLLSPLLVIPMAIGAVVVVVILGIVLQPDGSGSDATENWTLLGPDMDVPDFGVRATSWSGGEEFILSENLEKPTVMYFVAAWCFTCIPETQALARLYEEVGDDVNILIFDIDTTENERDLRRFKDNADGADHLWVMDDGSVISRSFGVRTLDTTIIIDRSGAEAFRDSVPTGYRKLNSEITALLDGHPVTPEYVLPDLPGIFYPDIGRDHLEAGEAFDRYLSDPPALGPHAPVPVRWGVSEEPIPKEVLVHNLEHGGVLLLHRCQECAEVEQLREFAERYLETGRKVILSPYPTMDSEYALVSWGYLDTFDEIDPARISEFLELPIWQDAPEGNAE